MNTIRVAVTLPLSLLLCITISFSQDAQFFYAESKNALEKKDHAQFYTSIKKAYGLHPYNQNILWHAGLAAALTGKTDEAISFLVKAININADYDLDDPHLSSLKDHPGFQDVIKLKSVLNQPVIQSDTAFVIEDRQLHLESIAFDPIGNTLYGGSIHKRKIIKIDEHGVVSDFTQSEQYGLASVFGLKIDVHKRILWACSSPMPEMQNYDSTVSSSLFQFDLKTGRLTGSCYPSDSLDDHIFGDLALDSQGIPYVSDSKNNIIYKYHSAENKLVPYFTSTEFWNIQGLTFFSSDEVLLISDYIKGIFRLETKTMKLSKMGVMYDLSLKGADGIYFFKNSLITIQNGVQPNRVARHSMDNTGSKFTKYEYIDNAHPAFGEPTIGSLSGLTFYYVANSQWNGYEKGMIKTTNALQPIVILRHTLKK